MKTKTVLTVVASAAFAVFAQGAFAQASAPVSRADVKAETKAAPKTPAGQGPGAMGATTGMRCSVTVVNTIVGLVGLTLLFGTLRPSVIRAAVRSRS